MLMDILVVTNTTFLTIRQTVTMAVLNTVVTRETYCTAARLGVVADQQLLAEYLNITQ